MSGARSRTVYHSSKMRTIALALGCVIFVALGAALVTVEEPLTATLGMVTVLLFGGSLIGAVRQLFRRAPELVLTDRGLTHHRLGTVTWPEIERLHVGRVQGQRFLNITLRDPDAYLSRSSLRTRILSRGNRGLGHGSVSISAVTLPVSVYELAGAIHHHCPRLGVDGMR